MSLNAGARGRTVGGQAAVVAGARLVVHQFRYDLLIFVRNRQSMFFTLMLPVIFLVIFAGVFHNDTTTLRSGEKIKESAYYVPQIIALGIVSAAFSNVVGVIIYQRETGVLKRRRATPVPAWVIVAGRALTAVALSFLLVAVLLVVGRVAYGVTLRAGAIPGVVLTTLVGALSLCCVGYALTTLVDSNESAQPVIQAITLPIFFISGTFFPESIVPRVAAARCRHLPRAASRACPADRVQSGRRQRCRWHGSAGAGHLGDRRHRDRHAPVQLDAARRPR